MKSIHIFCSQQFPCEPEQLFALLKDGEAMGKAAGLPIETIVHGAEPGGPGTVRRVGPPVIGIEETIVEVIANERIRYRISRNGGPIRNHRAEMRLRSTASGTELIWEMNFDVPCILAGAIRPALAGLAGVALKRIRRQLESALPAAQLAS